MEYLKTFEKFFPKVAEKEIEKPKVSYRSLNGVYYKKMPGGQKWIKISKQEYDKSKK